MVSGPERSEGQPHWPWILIVGGAVTSLSVFLRFQLVIDGPGGASDPTPSIGWPTAYAQAPQR
jgi:hypothetical protein